MVAKKTFPDYTPVGKEISAASSFVQAATALDLAAKFAMENRDSEQLAQVAMVWIEMGSRLNGGSEEEMEEGDVAGDSEDYPLGFAHPAVDAEIKRKRNERDADKSNR